MDGGRVGVDGDFNDELACLKMYFSFFEYTHLFSQKTEHRSRIKSINKITELGGVPLVIVRALV